MEPRGRAWAGLGGRALGETVCSRDLSGLRTLIPRAHCSEASGSPLASLNPYFLDCSVGMIKSLAAVLGF